MREAYRRIRKDAAAGVDGVTAAQYEADLEANLSGLLERFKSGRYRAPAVRRVHLEKPGTSKTRPIGIPTLEDKILQRAVLMVLEPVYEQDFVDCSYGFRPGRGAHQALQSLWEGLMEFGGGWVIDLDIEDFFGSVDWGHLRSFLDQRVQDGVIRRAIGKWLNAGVMEAGELSYPQRGAPQGGVVSPTLSERSDNVGESPDPCGVPRSGSVLSSPSSTPTRTHFPTSRLSDPSATRIRSISSSLVRSRLSKNDSMSASRIQLTLPWYTARFSARIASWALRPGRKPYEHSRKSCSYTASSTSRSAP